MRPQRVAWKMQGIAGILVDTSRAQDSARVFVRVIHRDGNICAASSLSNPLKISPTGNGSSALLQRHVAFWPESDDPVFFEAREGERFQVQVCLNIPGKGNFPIGAGSWEQSANNDVSDVFVGCALASDKRRSIAYCIDSKGGAMLRVVATLEDSRAESTCALHEDSNMESNPSSALKSQQRSQYSSLDDNPLNVSIERTLSTSFEPEDTCELPVKRESEMRPHNSKAKSRFGRFFQRSNNTNSERKKKNRSMPVASPSVPAKQNGARKDGKQPKGTTNSRRAPFWASSPKPAQAKAKPSKSLAKESLRQVSPAYSPVVRSGPVDCDDFDDGSVVGYEGLNWVDNADNEMPVDDVNAITKDLFPSERNVRRSSTERPLPGVLNQDQAPRHLVLHPGKAIPRQFSEDSETFSDVFERPLTKMQLRSSSPRTTTPSPTLERFGPSKMVSSYRTQSPTAVWESMSSRTPSPVEITIPRATEANIVNPRQSVQHLPSQPSPRTEKHHGAIPSYGLSDADQEMDRFQRRQVETSPESLEYRSSPHSSKSTVQRRPTSRVEQQKTTHTYSRDTQPWQSEQPKPESNRFSDTCLRMGQPTPGNGIFTCGTHTDNGGRMHHFDKECWNVKKGHERACTPVNETQSTVDSDNSETGGHTTSEPPPDFLFCQGDGSYFCKPDEDAVLRRRQLWREKMCYVAEHHPSTVGEKHNVDYPSFEMEPRNFASGPLKYSRGGYERSTSQKVRMTSSEPYRTTRTHNMRSSQNEDKKPGSPVPPTLESWSPKELLEENAKTLGQSIVALVEPFAACALVRPPDRPAVPSKVPSTIEGEEASVGELTATSYERQIDRMRRRQTTSQIQETLRSSQQSALKFFGLKEDALDIRSRNDRTCSVSTKKEDYFSDYKGLQ